MKNYHFTQNRYHAVAVLEKLIDYAQCDHCAFFIKSTKEQNGHCYLRSPKSSDTGCYYPMENLETELPIVFIPKKDRTV